MEPGKTTHLFPVQTEKSDVRWKWFMAPMRADCNLEGVFLQDLNERSSLCQSHLQCQRTSSDMVFTFVALSVHKLPTSFLMHNLKFSCWYILLLWEFRGECIFSLNPLALTHSFESHHITFLFRYKLNASVLAGEPSPTFINSLWTALIFNFEWPLRVFSQHPTEYWVGNTTVSWRNS